MSSTANLGTLRVILGAETAGLDKGLANAQSNLTKFYAGLDKAMLAASAAAATATAAIGVAVKKSIDEADKMGKMSQSIGVPVEELSRLKYAADLSDVSFEALGKNVGKLSKAMVEVAGGGAGPAAEAFKALGVSVTNADGSLKTSSQVIGEVAGKFETYKDGAAKTALAMAIFGKAGAEMIPLLNSGRDGLKEMADEADRFGVVIDAKTSKSAEAFNDNLTRMHAAFNGMVTMVTARMLPGFEELSNRMVAASKDADGLRTAADAITASLRFVANEVIITKVQFERWLTEVKSVWEILSQPNWMNFGETLSKAWSKLREEGSKTEQTIWTLKATLSSIKMPAPEFDWSKQIGGIPIPTFDWSGQIANLQATSNEVAKYIEEWSKVPPPLLAAGDAQKNAFEKFIDSQKKALAGQQAEFEADGMAIGAKERLRTVLQGLAVVQANGIVLTDAQRVKLTEAANAADLMALKLGSVALIGQTNPFEAIGLQIDAINLKLQEGGLKAQDYAVLLQQAAQLTQKLWADSATSMAGSFENIGSSMSQLSDSWTKFAKAGQAIGATVAFVNAYVAASEAFAKTPFPANIAIAAGVLAKGMAMAAAIKSVASPTGMMTGGQFTVRGSGGPDSVPVQFMASPGEQIDVWRPDQGGGADPRRGSSGGGGTTLVMNGFMWGREQARDMVEFLNQSIADGHKIKLEFR